MHNEKRVSIKEEQPDEMCAEQTTMFLGDPLESYWSTDHLNEDSRLNFGWDENENNNAALNTLLHTILEGESECCPPPLLVPKNHLEDPKLNLEADETENNVVGSTSFASNMMRLTGDMAESSDISYEETFNQGVVICKRKIDSEESTSFAMFFEEQETLFGTRLKCSLTENICHTFSCSFCLQRFPSKYRLIMHVFVHIDGVHPPRFVCKSCGEVFPSHASLNKHLKMSEVDQALSADNSEKFDFSGDHRSTTFAADQEEYVIEQTESQCSSKQPRKSSDIQFNDTSNTHTVTHNEEITDRHVNDGTSNTTGNLNTNSGLLPEKMRLKCVVSGESCIEVSSLKRNAIIHTGLSPPKCDICGKSFTQLGSLKMHALLHTGKRPHKCDICEKSFTRLTDLKIHTSKHTGIRPHKCNICEKSFIRLIDLKSHALKHTGIRPHKCIICEKSFIRLSDLKNHALKHTGIKPH